MTNEPRRSNAHEIERALTTMTKRVRAINETNGWFDKPVSVLEGHMLLVTEVAEASEAWREHGTADQTGKAVTHSGLCALFDQVSWRPHPCNCGALDNPKPEGLGSEYADILIRLLDQCDRDGIDLAAEFERKCAYNATRGYRHGGKRA